MGEATKHILLIEDDHSLATWIRDYLIQHHFDISLIDRGDTAADTARELTPDLILLDINLPGLDGYAVCRQLREFFSGPVIMLTANDAESDEVIGLEMGADDYISKPVSPRLLLARIKAQLRRVSAPENENTNILSFGCLSIDLQARSVTLSNNTVDLSSAEFLLLSLLAQHAGEPMPRQELVKALRGFDYDGFDRSIDVRISRLRKKLLDDPKQPGRLKTVWGVGYLFVANAWETERL